MINTLYVENNIENHERVARISSRLNQPEKIACQHYREVFNISAQNFRQQKQNPSLILAHKPKDFVQTCPSGYGVGGRHNYYFSHMLNCVYDCRYCFLQGMYRSANYVVFVNYEDFDREIRQVTKSHQQQNEAGFNAHDLWFFSGYDCDSLVFEPWTGFIEHTLNTFEGLPAYLELRTKSTQVSPLLKRKAMDNVVVAFSFTSGKLHRIFEDKVPSIEKRVAAMKKLADAGWKIGLRFDPLIWFDDYLQDFNHLLETIFQQIPQCSVHSVTLGGFRLPLGFYRSLKQIYPDNILFAQYFEEVNGMIAFPSEKEEAMLSETQNSVMHYLPKQSIFVMR